VRKSYREFANDLLAVAGRLIHVLGLWKIPYFTGKEIFMLRVPSTMLERVMRSSSHR
jgi:hypothetical protein